MYDYVVYGMSRNDITSQLCDLMSGQKYPDNINLSRFLNVLDGISRKIGNNEVEILRYIYYLQIFNYKYYLINNIKFILCIKFF